MRISIVSANVSPLAEPGEPGWCGQAVRVAELADALAASGHQVSVLARRDDPARPATVEPRPGLTIRHLDGGPAAPLSQERLVATVPELAGRLEQLWQAERPELVHAHHWTSGLTVGAAVRDVGAAMVQTFHSLAGIGPDVGPAGRASAERAVARSADRVVALSEDELFSLVQRRAPRSRVRVVPAGIDTEAWRPDGPSLRRAERPRLLTLAGPAAEGGVDEAVEALHGVSGAELYVAGGPSAERAGDDPDLARLCALARRVGVDRRVRFLGAVGRDDVPRLVRSCNVLVSAPRQESSGTAALEAMACGRAVVATVGGLRDAVVDQVTGVQVLPGRPAELAAAVRGVLADPGTCSGFGIAGRDRATSRFARQRVVESITEVYREALAERATADADGVASG
ncbi:MAG: glycosyltransferase [Pseudonocardia sp.]|nr:glycosyltransferase [Pseudonocardia sp.]